MSEGARPAEKIPIRERKVRCTMCRDYFAKNEMYRQGIGGVCTAACYTALIEKSKAKRERRAVNRVKHYRSYGRRISPSVREVVKERDGYQCRFCGDTNLQLHHIEYRSEGGPDTDWNLISLCPEHHALMHSNKRKWQPVLKWVQVSYYFNETQIDVVSAMRLVRACHLEPGFEDDVMVGE